MPKKTLKLVIPVLMIFFTLQVLSHLFLKLGEAKTGEDKTGAKTSGLFKCSALLMPLDAEPIYEYGYALLFENSETKNNEAILKSIAAFEKALDLNELFYMSYYYLGKALFLSDLPGSYDFDRGVTAFKRAALIRGNKYSNIAADTLKLFLSQWPLLKDDDKTFCRNLLEKSIAQLSAEDFNAILDVWRLYNQDIDFFNGIFKTNPQYYFNFGRELGLMETNLEMRQAFLAKYEVYYLGLLKSKYQMYIQESTAQESTDCLEQLKYLDRIAHIDGYHRLFKNTDFNEKEYLDFRKELGLHILQLFFEREGWQTDTVKKKDIERYIFAYCNEPLSKMEVESFSSFLNKHNFFASQDFKSFYIKQLLHFKRGDYAQVIEDSEALRKSLVFVQREHLDDYTNILLLLADAFFENKLMARAMSILEEIEKISPGLLEIYWRMMKIESFIGADNNSNNSVGKEMATRAENYRKVRESRFSEPGAGETHQTVYFVDNDELVIGISDKLKELMKSRHIFQVFIDGKIYYEAYKNQLGKEGHVVIPVEEHAAKCHVLIKII